MRKLFSVLLTAVMVMGVSGCSSLFEPAPVENSLISGITDSNVVSARFVWYDKEEEDFVSEVLTVDQLEEFTEKLDSYHIESHIGHTDYFWGGYYAVELTLEDGTYLTYDGTCLELSRTAFDDESSSDDRIKRRYIEVIDADFWNDMSDYFPLVKDNLKDLREGW